ncbi:conserved hypothetical protein [Solidesulfovibrio fructosivorans JJ]]|uniref:Uncharacterized protein n=1 Tax=Solidesulfovibrio fructosivorans JJ] TaxID=596151 RepID=E1JR00_SOLFR|nr:hypothetical protein [Solidesulfovibrio fructosivorans]EFL53001.1 conserved hypothetical protein [Solidesulfovibrio fructosivorans JJ]]
MSYFLQLAAYDLAARAETALYFADAGMTSKPDDSPANTYFDGRLSVPCSYDATVFADGVTGGVSDGGFGEIEMVSPEGGLDVLAGYAVDGRRFELRRGEDRFDTAVTIMSGVVESLELGWDTVVVNIRSRKAELETPIQTTLYAGTNSGPEGVEGTADDLQGKEKPLAFGPCDNITLTCVNTSLLIFQAHDGRLRAVRAVRDKGMPLTATRDYATLADLQAATFTAGQYATCLALGLIRLWTSPAGDVTADVDGDVLDGVYVADAAGIVERILRTRAGWTEADFSAADLAALTAANAAEVCLFVGAGDSLDIDAALDTLLTSIGAWWVPNRHNVIRFGILAAPVGPPKRRLSEVEILDSDSIEWLPAHDDAGGVPYWRTKLNGQKNWSKQSASSLAGGVSDEARAWLAEEWRTVTAEDASVRTVHPLAPELERDSLLRSAAACQAEADRLQALHGVWRTRLRVPFFPDEVEDLDFGDVVELVMDRFGLAAGKLFVVIGLNVDRQNEVTELELYG